GRVADQIEAFVARFPTVERVRAPGEKPLVSGHDVIVAPSVLPQQRIVAEVILDVLFSREIRAPRRAPTGAITERTERTHPVRIVLRAHQRRTASRSADVDRRVRSDAPCITRVFHPLPSAALANDLDDRHALRSLRHTDDVRVALDVGSTAAATRASEPGVGRIHERVVRKLVVHAQEAVIAAPVEREEMYGIAVLTELLALQLGGSGLQERSTRQLRGVEIRHAGKETLTPTHDEVVRVSGRQKYRVSRTTFDRLEPESAGRAPRLWCERCGAAPERQGHQHETGLQHPS